MLKSATVQDAFKAGNVLLLTADWTNGDPDITKMLQQFKRARGSSLCDLSRRFGPADSALRVAHAANRARWIKASEGKNSPELNSTGSCIDPGHPDL